MPRKPKEAPASKKEAVQRALDAGVKMPIAIVGYIKRTFNIDITPAHVSTLKGNFKREGKPGPKPRKEAPSASHEAGLTLQDLRSLADMARRAGGFDRLREFLDELGGVR